MEFARLTGARNKRPEQMSLAERQMAAQSKTAATQKAQNAPWAGLDALVQGSSGSGSGSGPGSARSTPAPSTTSNSLLDEFDVFQTAPAPKPAPPPGNSQSVKKDEDDDPFAVFNKPIRPTASPASSALSQELPRRSRSQQAPVPGSDSTVQSRPSTPANVANDAALAQLIDMGFEQQDATRGLAAMGGNVSGAINWLMAEAQGAPLPAPPRQRTGAKYQEFGEVAELASQFGTSMLSAASTFWTKGKKQFARAVDQYSHPKDPNTPAWMREREKYEARERAHRPSSPRLSDGRGRNDRRSRETEQSRSALSSRASSRSQTLNQTEGSLKDGQDDFAIKSRPSRHKTETRSRADLYREKQQSLASSETRKVSPAAPPQNPHKGTSPQTATPSPAPEIDLLNTGDPAESSGHEFGGAQRDIVDTARHAGNDAFKRGDYALAVTNFSSALESTPSGNRLATLLLSNRAAALLKVGDARGALDDTNRALLLLPNDPLKTKSTVIADGVSVGDIWSKLISRRAQASEHLEKYSDALADWKLLLDSGFATPSALDGKRRCQSVLNPKSTPVPTTVPKSKRRGWGTSGATPQSAAGKAALKKVLDAHANQDTIESEKDQARDRVAEKIDIWKKGKEDNIRALLSSLEAVLWPGCSWTPVALSELVTPKKVRLVYMKAVARTHPDKVSESESTETKMISQGIFITLNKSWETFRVANGL